MNENIRAIYENGVLRPLRPLNFPEHSEVEIDVREIAENSAETHRDKVAGVLREAGLTTPIKFPNAEKLSDDERRRLGKLFSAEKPLGDYIDEDREARG
jgi:predicted DNA-binding antitoxin AbrB/MazE fold protein